MFRVDLESVDCVSPFVFTFLILTIVPRSDFVILIVDHTFTIVVP